MRRFVPMAFVMWVVGCAASHEVDVEGGARRLDSGRTGCDFGDAGPPFSCAERIVGNVCAGGREVIPRCQEGAWICPEETILISECWCFGVRFGCECTPTGWVCPELDAGVPFDADIPFDGPAMCPTDFAAAEGTPCGFEGASCGGACDPCGLCNVLVCRSGVWTRLEAHPPPGPCRSFACGPELRCNVEAEYCEHILSDVGGVPDQYLCRAVLPGCTSCECTPDPVACVQDAAGGRTLTSGGG